MRLSTMLGWIGGIALLYVATYPYYVNDKQGAKRWACLSNLKQQGLGLLQYSADDDQGFPSRDRWMDDLLPYSKSESILHDPSFYRDGAAQGYGYAMNATLAEGPPPANPASVPLVYDSVNPIRNASDRFASLPAPERHKGRNNLVHADGHYRMVPRR